MAVIEPKARCRYQDRPVGCVSGAGGRDEGNEHPERMCCPHDDGRYAIRSGTLDIHKQANVGSQGLERVSCHKDPLDPEATIDRNQVGSREQQRIGNQLVSVTGVKDMPRRARRRRAASEIGK